MLVLVVAAATARKVPTIVEQESHDVSDFHLDNVGRVPQRCLAQECDMNCAKATDANCQLLLPNAKLRLQRLK